MKTCTKCGEIKELSEFRRATGAPDGHRPDCKKCSKVHDPDNTKPYSDTKGAKISDVWKDQARIDMLCALWDEGITAAEIGRRMGLTKNQIIGKVARLNLPMRADPHAKRNEIKKAPRTPALAAINANGCVWPFGHPGENDFHFCGHKVARQGVPYCAGHMALAYVPPKPLTDSKGGATYYAT